MTKLAAFFSGCLCRCICRGTLLIDNRVNLIDLTGFCHVVQGSKNTHCIRFLSESLSAFLIMESGPRTLALSFSSLSIIDFFAQMSRGIFTEILEKMKGFVLQILQKFRIAYLNS